MTTDTPATAMPRSLFMLSVLYGGLVCMAGVLGTKVMAVGPLAVESGIIAFLPLVAISSAIAEMFGRDVANRLVRFGFIPLIVSMILIRLVILLPPAPFWDKQAEFAMLLGQSSRMMLAGLIAYGISQTLNVTIFTAMTRRQGRLLWLRALVASVSSQVVDSVLFITIAFLGVFPIAPILEGQIISKIVLSAVVVPPLIYLLMALACRIDAGSKA